MRVTAEKLVDILRLELIKEECEGVDIDVLSSLYCGKPEDYDMDFREAITTFRRVFEAVAGRLNGSDTE